MRKILNLVALVPFVLVLACADSSKAPAEAALKSAEAALATLGPDASKYAAEGVAEVRKSYAAAKELVGTKEYEGALRVASRIPGEVKEVIAAASAKKGELVKDWGEASAKVTATVSAIKDRLATLEKGKRLPAGIDKAVIARAHEGIDDVESGIARLAEDVKGGMLGEAVTGAKALQAKGEAIMKSLGSP